MRSMQLLSEAILTKEASLGALRRKIIQSLGYKQGLVPRTVGAAGAAGAVIPIAELLELGPMASSGLTAGAGVVGHDIAGMAAQNFLQQKALAEQLSKPRKIRKYFL